MTTTEPAPPASPTIGEMLAETVPLIGVIPVAGPAVILLAGPWLLLGLVLAGPFALLLTTVVLLGVEAVLVRLIRAIVLAPYRLFRDLRAYRTHHVPVRVLVVRRGAA